MSRKNPFEIYEADNKKGSMRTGSMSGTIIDCVPPNQPVHGEQMKKSAMQYSSRNAVIVAVLMLFIISTRAFYLQILQNERYINQAEGNRTHTTVIKALRGVVYDQNGVPLVRNIPSFRLMITARELPHRSDQDYEQVLESIQSISDLGDDEFNERLLRSFQSGQPVELRTNISYNDALPLMIQAQHIRGASVETFYVREYLAGEPFGHIMGYMSKLTEDEYEENRDNGYQFNDDIGKTGLEASYEAELRGRDGLHKSEVDYRGREISVMSDSRSEAGFNLKLSIDINLQEYIYNLLGNAVELQGLPGAAAIALDPNDGSVLALVSYPSFDSNVFTGGISQKDYDELIRDEKNPLFNRCIAGTYPSGSVFKPVVAAAALEEGVITASTSVFSSGGIQIDQYFYPDWKAGGHGDTNVIKALAESVNTFFYLAGGGDNETTTGLGVERITGYAKQFGLSEPSGIDLAGEQSGFLPSKAWKEEYKDEQWYIGDTYHLAIGQGDILATPIQIANYTAAFANGGTLFRPHIVHSITTQNDELVRDIEADPLSTSVVSAQTIQTVRRGLREAVLTGSAKLLQSLPVSSAGKTGTAQFGDEEKTHSWFTAFAPYEKPEIVITVLAEEGGEGNETALPLAQSILQYYFSPPEIAVE
ncbi:MAG: penicillin-binding protein 2 [Candidatus Kerfeldbacteria bacterium]